jgi:hypothetical protein
MSSIGMSTASLAGVSDLITSSGLLRKKSHMDPLKITRLKRILLSASSEVDTPGMAALLRGANTCALMILAALQSVGALRKRAGAPYLHTLMEESILVPAFAPLKEETFEEAVAKAMERPGHPVSQTSERNWAQKSRLRPICALLFCLLSSICRQKVFSAVC